MRGWSETPPRMTAMRFQPVRGLVYVDESGQIFPPRPGQPNEVGLLAAFVVSDTRRNRESVATAASRVAQSPKNAPPDDVLRAVADLVRDRGYVVIEKVELAEHDRGHFEGTLQVLGSSFRQKRKDLGQKGLDLRLDFIERQYRDEARRCPAYMATLVVLFQRMAKWFRAQGMAPALSVVLDAKLPPTAKELVEFLLRFGVCMEFPELYADRLGAVMGVDPLPELACRVGTDDRDDGLRIAHVIAYAHGKTLRGQDPDGRMARFCADLFRPHEGTEAR